MARKKDAHLFHNLQAPVCAIAFYALAFTLAFLVESSASVIVALIIADVVLALSIRSPGSVKPVIDGHYPRTTAGPTLLRAPSSLAAQNRGAA